MMGDMTKCRQLFKELQTGMTFISLALRSRESKVDRGDTNRGMRLLAETTQTMRLYSVTVDGMRPPFLKELTGKLFCL